MLELQRLLDNNRAWAERLAAEQPEFFPTLARQQAPNYLWIGCADSRVPANQIVGLLPGEVFVHRNVANLVVDGDLNCLSVVQFAVDVLKVKHVIICGHYGCGGVKAALEDERHGLVDTWLKPIQALRDAHAETLKACTAGDARLDRLCELNVIAQAVNVGRTDIVREAWRRGQALWVHALIYGLKDGRLRDTGFTVGAESEVESRAQDALARRIGI